MNEQSNLERECLQLIHTIHQLMRQAPDGWVSWYKAAKEQEGSEEWAEALSAMAQLPQHRGYFIFANNGRVVKLSAKGLALTQSTTITYVSETEKIAQAVKRYASRLQQQRLTVMGIARVAHVGQRYVHAVQVNLGDGIVPADSPALFRPRYEGSAVHGRVVGQEADGSTLYVALDQQIYDYQLPATLAIDRAYLLHQLAVSIAQLPAIPPLGQQLLHKSAERSLPPYQFRTGRSDVSCLTSALGALLVGATRSRQNLCPGATYLAVIAAPPAKPHPVGSPFQPGR